MYIEQITPNISGIRVCSCGIHKKGSVCDIHLHTEIEFIKVLTGKYTCIVDNTEYEVNAGETILINRNVPHSTVTADGTSSILLQADPKNYISDYHEKLYHLSSFLNENKYACFVFKNGKKLTDEINECISGIYKEFFENKTANTLFIKSDLYRLVALLYRSGIFDDYFSKISKNKLDKLLPVLNHIDSNFKEHLTLENLAKIIHLNPEYFSRLFKSITGKNIFEYINFVRIHNAGKLLLNTDMTVLETAFESGFSSISYFNRSFCKFYGCTPSMYRKIKTNEEF